MQQTKLKIGILASNVIRVPPIPPEKYVPSGWSGAPELIVHFISEGLIKRGHQVSLFASGDSETQAKLVSATEQSSFLAGKLKQHESYEYLLISKAYQIAAQENFDIIHSHFDIKSAHFAVFSKVPTISTLHSPLTGTIKEILEHYKDNKDTQYYAGISNNQRKSLLDLKYAVTAYNGVEVEKIPFSEEKEDYLVFAGRLVKEKGVAEAIEVARKSNHRLFIFGSVKEDDY